MQIRAMTPADLSQLDEIDATIESSDYLHVERAAEEMSLTLRVERRPLREKSILSNPLDDELRLAYRQVATGADEGITLVAEHEQQIVASALAQPDAIHGTMRLIDVRVDYDFRRQGIGLAMAFQIIGSAREAEMRAVAAETRSGNFPANQFFTKLAFQLAGLDVQRYTNHDLVSEMTTLFWYASWE